MSDDREEYAAFLARQWQMRDGMPLRSNETTSRRCQRMSDSSYGRSCGLLTKGVIAPVPGIMRLFWAFSSSNPPESHLRKILACKYAWCG